MVSHLPFPKTLLPCGVTRGHITGLYETISGDKYCVIDLLLVLIRTPEWVALLMPCVNLLILRDLKRFAAILFP